MPDHLFKFPRASVGTVGLIREWMHPRPSCFRCLPISRLWLASPFAKCPGSRQNNKGLIAAVQSCYNLHSHLACLTLASFYWLCFWVIQLILFTNNSFCSTLRVSQRETDHYEPEHPHSANFTFYYGPTNGFTFNQHSLWNSLWGFSSSHSFKYEFYFAAGFQPWVQFWGKTETRQPE